MGNETDSNGTGEAQGASDAETAASDIAPDVREKRTKAPSERVRLENAPSVTAEPPDRVADPERADSTERTDSTSTDRASNAGDARSVHAKPYHVTPSPELERMGAMLPDTVLFQIVTWMVDGEERRRLVFVGRAIERLLDVPHERVVANGILVYQMMEPTDLTHLAALEREAVRTRSSFRLPVRFVLGDGTRRVFDISAAPTALPEGRILWDGAATDITAAASSSAERDRLIELVEAADDLIAVVRPDGAISYLNRAGRRLLGLGASDSLPGANALWPDGEGAQRLRHAVRVAAREGLWRGDATIRRADGTLLPVTQALVSHRAPPLRPDTKPGRVTHFSVIMRDNSRAAETERALREAGDRTSLELGETAHRVKNLFALVPAIIALSARSAGSVPELAEAARERVEALARAHALTLASADREGAELATLAHDVLEPYATPGDGLVMQGPPCTLDGPSASTIGLVVHELATNAAKYGVLAARGRGVSGAHIALKWSIDPTNGPDMLRIEWREVGGDPAPEPRTRGFGTSLLDRLVSARGGRIERDWSEAGFRASIGLPLN